MKYLLIICVLGLLGCKKEPQPTPTQSPVQRSIQVRYEYKFAYDDYPYSRGSGYLYPATIYNKGSRIIKDIVLYNKKYVVVNGKDTIQTHEGKPSQYVEFYVIVERIVPSFGNPPYKPTPPIILYQGKGSPQHIDITID